MLSSRMAKASLVAGALILATIGPAMAAGGPGDAGAGKEDRQRAPEWAPGWVPVAAVTSARRLARTARDGGGGGPMDNQVRAAAGRRIPVVAASRTTPVAAAESPAVETAGNNLSFPVLWSELGELVVCPAPDECSHD